jgi:hypothetical protein
LFVVAVTTCFQKIFIDFGVGRGARGGNACARHEKTALRIPACDGMRWRAVCYAVRPSHERDSHGQSFWCPKKGGISRAGERGGRSLCAGAGETCNNFSPPLRGGKGRGSGGGSVGGRAWQKNERHLRRKNQIIPLSLQQTLQLRRAPLRRTAPRSTASC